MAHESFGAGPNGVAAGGEPLPSGVSVVVPCLNSEATLTELVEQLGAVLRRVAVPYEITLIDDGSRDGTWDVIAGLATHRPWVQGIQLMRNYGQHQATLCGVRAARYDVTVTLDDDLQHPPAEIPRLLSELRADRDVVYGVPKTTSQPLYRRLLSWMIRCAIAVASRQQTVHALSGFRAFRTSLREASQHHQSPELLLDVLLGWGTTRIATTEVAHGPRRVGRSNYGTLRLVNVALLLWMGYTTLPLRLASLLGFTFVGLGILMFGYVLAVYFSEGSLPGFPFLVSTITIFSGVQLFTLGIIGEYLARMFQRSLDRPAYVVKHVITGRHGSVEEVLGSGGVSAPSARAQAAS